VTVAEALELTALVARREPEPHNRFAARWLRYDLAEREVETLAEIAFVAGCLVALAGGESKRHAYSHTARHFRGFAR
jgi:hypothetical protein